MCKRYVKELAADMCKAAAKTVDKVFEEWYAKQCERIIRLADGNYITNLEAVRCIVKLDEDWNRVQELAAQEERSEQ